MSLNREQRVRLRQQLGPLINEALKEGVTPVIQEEVGRVLRSGQSGSNYLDRALDGSRRVDDLPKGHNFARVIRCYLAGEGDCNRAANFANENGFGESVTRALEGGSAEGGGLLIPSPLADEVIELLRARSIVRLAGPRTITIPAGNLQFPRIDSGSTAGYVTEGGEIPVSELKTGAVNLLARKLAALTILSSDLLRFGVSQDVDAIVLDDLLQAISTTEDVKMLFGKGAEAEPLGLFEQIVAANKFAANATINLTNVQADLRDAELKLRNANVPMRNPVWVMAPRSRLFLREVRDTEDRPVFKEEVNAGRLNGMRLEDTTNVPINLGGGSDESEVALIDFSEVFLGDVASVEIARSDAAMIVVGGVSQSLFQRDRSAIRTIMRNDVQMRHRVSGAVIQAVKWGV